MSKEKMTMSTHKTSSRASAPRRAVRVALAVALAVVSLGALAASASASQEVTEFEVGSSTQRAGAHPDLIARLRLDKPGQPEVAKDVTVNMPTGVFGNPGAVFKCRASVFVLNQCPPGAQVGLISIIANYENNPNYILGTAPLYNMETVGEEESARLAFVVPTVQIPVVIPIKVRNDSDLGLKFSINSISQTLALTQASLTVWGFPAAKEHDPSRFYPGEPDAAPGCPGVLVPSCLSPPNPPSGVVNRPFIDNPSVCTGEPLDVSIDVVTYQDPVPSHVDGQYPATTNCEEQRFDPVFNLALTSNEADSPSGLDIQMKANQFLTGEAPAPSTLRSATLKLPAGVSINPDAADGQISCDDSEAHFDSLLPGDCPDNSKIGTVEVKTPALEHPLLGSLYIGKPLPDNQYRVFMIFDGEGIHAKIEAKFVPDPVTGQLTMSVTDLPQTPFEEFNLHLFASDRGLVATPESCTIAAANATMVPWNSTQAPQLSTPNIEIDSGPDGKPCPAETRPFNPRLVAGSSSPTAGDFSSFILRLDRDDGDQFLGDLNFKMPPGFTGDLRGISYCPEAQILAAAANSGRAEQASPSCPAASQIGTTNVAAGPGEHPFHAVGKMYLSGPFKGAPLSLAAITPALAGPYDYGVVVVRVALHVDPQTAQVTAVSDKVPSIIGGIPIRMRSIQVNIDREHFTINPTNCSPFTVDSQGIGDQGTVASFSSYFQVVNCSRLPFKPKITVKQLGGKKGTVRSANPSLQFDLNTRPGDDNVKSLTVTLSNAFEIDQEHLGNLCTEKELAATQCAGRQQIGEASTTTPLLDQPLSGPVYAVSGSGGLPRLAFILNGQVDLLPRGETVTVSGNRLQTTVGVVPDAPIGHFHLVIFGGKHGYLANTRSLCKHPPVIGVAFTAQNGRTASSNAPIGTACSKAARRSSRRHHH